MILREYFCKNVDITDVDNIHFTGFVETYTPKIDSEYNQEEIAITISDDYLSFKKGDLIGFREDEIKKIEILDKTLS